MDKDKIAEMTYEGLLEEERRAEHRLDFWAGAVAKHVDNAKYCEKLDEAKAHYKAVSKAISTFYDVKVPEYEIKLILKDTEVLDLLQLLADSCDAETRRKFGDTEQLFREIEKQTLGQPAGIEGVEMVLKENEVGMLCALVLRIPKDDDKCADMLAVANKIKDQRNRQMQGRGFDWEF